MDKNPVAGPEGYAELLTELKQLIRKARVRAALAVNCELVLLYWSIGNDILARQEHEGWGARVLDRLAADLQRSFPGMKGLSARNVKYMRALAKAWPERSIVQQAVAQLPWGHIVRILDKVKDPQERLWYVHKTVEQGWSRNVLVMQINTGLYRREGAAITNFEDTLPPSESDLARQTLKDPYNFDFLKITGDVSERVLERGLVEQIRDFLLELGRGFAFVGSEVPLEVGGEVFRIDILFYHVHLRCYVVIELKVGAFRPEYVGKLNFYLSAVDDHLRHADDKRTIGILLCRERNRVVAEYALRGLTQPLGISEYELAQALSKNLKDELPSVEAPESELKHPPAKEPA
jgi:predicted nuclease of restriction endonuclease-like (RecB) superfamily